MIQHNASVTNITIEKKNSLRYIVIAKLIETWINDFYFTKIKQFILVFYNRVQLFSVIFLLSLERWKCFQPTENIIFFMCF